MLETALSRDVFIWALVLGVFFPAAIVAMGEIIMRLRQKSRPIAAPLSAVRNLVLPSLALVLVLAKVAGFDSDLTPVRIVWTVLLLCIVHTALSFLNVILFTGIREGSWQANVPQLFVDIARSLIVAVCLCIILAFVWKADLNGILATLGAGSIVVGLAIQDPVGNLFSGIVLMFERPMKIGDVIEVENKVGAVCETNWRSVHVATENMGVVVIPNGLLARISFTNRSRPAKIFSEPVVLSFSADDPPNKVKRVLLETAKRTPHVLLDPLPCIELLDFDGAAIDYRVTIQVANDWTLLGVAVDEYKTLIWYAARRAGLTMPIPASTAVNVNKETLDAKALEPIPAQDLEIFPRFSLTNGATNGKGVPKTALRTFARGEHVLVEGERLPGIYLILNGAVSLSAKDGQGRESEIGRVSRGEFFGEKALLAEASDITATALDDVELLLLDSHSLEQMLDRVPQLSREIGAVMETRRKALQGLRSGKATAAT